MSEVDRIKWDQRYSRNGGTGPEIPVWLPEIPVWLKEVSHDIPRQGAALDVAAGSGRLARWLARRGLDVLAVDVSAIGLALARQAADAEGLQIETLVRDLEVEPLPDGPFDVITCFHYRQRGLFPFIRARLRPGGVFIGEVATVLNLERHAHPSLQYLAEPGELKRDCQPLDLVYYQEGWFEEQAMARVVARR
ncbi:MAG TPA: class I SAM-dependent methyltransferase [Dehalococcoidia bacterium]|nr:class I SAM-dependent methyltransferase [Dehalococcoidia bacterium]